MMIRLLAILLLIAPSLAWGADITSTTSGNFSAGATWVGGVAPTIADRAIIAAGHNVTLDSHRMRVGSFQFAGASSQITCTDGASLIAHDWTTAATTDFFASEFQGSDSNDGTTETMGANGPEQTWAAGIAHTAGSTHVLFAKGGTYAVSGAATFGGGGTVGSYGQGDDNRYGPRPLWNLGATDSIRQTGSTATDVYHTEVSCGDSMTATLVMDRTSCVAPCAIEFKVDVDHRSLPSTEPRLFDGTELGGGEDFILPETVWTTFGDSGSGNWTTGAAATSATPWAKDMDRGPVAFHVYESAGSYDFSVTTRYGSETVTNTGTITVTSEDTEWPPGSGAHTFCVSTTTDFTGCPIDTDADGTCDSDDDLGASAAAQCRASDADFDTALATFCNIDVDDVRCLFHAGQTFNVDANTSITQSDDWMIGSFGSGNRPIIDSGSYTGNAVTMNEAPNGRIMDLNFIGDDTTADAKPIYFNTGGTGDCSGVEFDNLLISNVLVEDWGNGFNFRGNTTAGGEQWRPECAHDNLVIYESAVVNATTSTAGGVDLFMHGSSGAVLGGDYVNRQNHEHGVRAKRISDFVFAHLDMGRIGDATDNQGCGGSDDPAAGRHLMTIRNGPSGAWETDGDTEDEIAKVYTQRFAVRDNHIGVCADNALTLIVESTSNGDDHEHWHSYIIEGNLFNASQRSTSFGGAASTSFVMGHFAGADIMVKNNAFWMDCGIATGNCQALEFNNAKGNANGETANTASSRVHVYNNAFFAESTNSSTTSMIEIDADNRDTFIVNNLLVDLESATFLTDNGVNTSQCNDRTGATTACNPELTSNTAFSTSITGANPPSLDWFRLNTTYASGSNVGVVPDSGGAYLDVFGICRNSATGPWEGLDEDGGTACLESGTVTLFAPFLLP